MGREAWELAKALFNGVRRADVSMLAKQAAYSLIYALPSLILFVSSLALLIDRETNAGISGALNDVIKQQAPSELQPLLLDLVHNATKNHASLTVTSIISILLAIWGIGGGVGTLVHACNIAYGIKDSRSYITRTMIKIILAIIGGALMIVWFIIFTLGERAGDWLERVIGEPTIFSIILSSGRGWSMLFIACALLMLYSMGPDIETAIRWRLPGIIAATLALRITADVFSRVIGLVNPGSAFGAASSVLILLWAIYVVCWIIVLGGVINGVTGRRYDPVMISAIRQRHPASPDQPTAAA